MPDVTKLTDDEFTDYLVGLGKILPFCHLFKQFVANSYMYIGLGA